MILYHRYFYIGRLSFIGNKNVAKSSTKHLNAFLKEKTLGLS